jgi:hypothetical protein
MAAKVIQKAATAGRTLVRPQGIIAAYHRTLGTARAGSPAGVTVSGSTDADAVPKYRTNCRVDQDI